jgi:3-oxoacyl-[acyl-carrier protein] reductase
MSNQLAGKAALVTGGSRSSIGAAIAKRLAADRAAVALTYRTSPKKAGEVVRAIEAAGGKALAVPADSGDPAAVKAAVARTAEAFGRLDILVNNAGIAILKPLNDLTLDDFDRIVAVNVKGVFVATQEAARHMSEGGRIIMIGSVSSDLVHLWEVPSTPDQSRDRRVYTGSGS